MPLGSRLSFVCNSAGFPTLIRFRWVNTSLNRSSPLRAKTLKPLPAQQLHTDIDMRLPYLQLLNQCHRLLLVVEQS